MQFIASLNSLLNDGNPPATLNVTKISQAAHYTRTRFYEQHASMAALYTATFNQCIGEMMVGATPWLTGQAPHFHNGLRGCFRAYATYGKFMSLCADNAIPEYGAAGATYQGMMLNWNQMCAARITESYPWVTDPVGIAHYLNSGDERIMYYNLGNGHSTQDDADRTFQISYTAWCSALGVDPKTGKHI